MKNSKAQLSALLIIILLCAACRQQTLSASDVQLEMSVSDKLVGETTLLVAVKDKDGKAIENPGALSVRGDMDHAGMVPVFGEAQQAVDGLFTVPFEWTMGGGWIVEASLTLENGDIAQQTFHYEILSEAGAGDMAEMDHSDMEDMDHGDMEDMDHGDMAGETSAIYMTIRNRSDRDISIVSAESAAAGNIEFHQTIVEDEMARMEALDALFIPAGESIALQPGGRHIMLTKLTQDLLPQSQITLQLTSDSGEVYDLDISVVDMLMGELEDTVEISSLVFSNRWARAASAGLTSPSN